jgi:soluble lytic murein transglycosylase-like protein
MRKILLGACAAVALLSATPSFADYNVLKGEISRGKDGKLVVKPFPKTKVSLNACGSIERGPPDHIVAIVEENAKVMGLDPRLVLAIIKTESNYNHMAVSHKNARGLMQLLIPTAAQYGVTDLFNPHENIKAGMLYLKYLSDLYNGELKLMLSGYNAGVGAVKKYGGVPNYKETINYISKIESLLKCQS